MLAPPAFPKWLPSDVKIEAERILCSGQADEALVLRLATDKRMESVWRELAKHKQPHPQISEAWTILMEDRVDVPPPDYGDPPALFFWCAYTIASLGVAVGTISKLDLPIAKYRQVAAGLRLASTQLYFLTLKYGDPGGADAHAEKIETAAAFCERIADELIELKAAQAPLIVKRNHGNREGRGYVRMLAVETRSLFGQLLAGTLATVANVALALKDNEKVGIKQVRNWCNLPQ
jgi:hypothetical protein